jgi:hypothetical protein
MALDGTTAITINGIQCWEFEPHEETDRRGSVGIRTIVCLWENRWSLATYLRGGVTQIGGVIIYTNPQVYPWANWLYCQGVSMDPQHGQGGTITDSKGMYGSKYATLKVQYRDFETIDTGGTGLEFGSDVMSVQGSSLKFAGGTDPVPGTMSRRIPIVNIPYQRTGIANLPISAFVAAAIAPLNSTAMTFNQAGVNVGASYVLFDGGRAFKRFTTAGNTGWDVQMNFAVRGIRWDYAYDSAGSVRQVVGRGGDPLIASSDLNALLNIN